MKDNVMIVTAAVQHQGLALEHATEMKAYATFITTAEISSCLQCSKASYLAWHELLEKLFQGC
jgi:hypothetical protein